MNLARLQPKVNLAVYPICLPGLVAEFMNFALKMYGLDEMLRPFGLDVNCPPAPDAGYTREQS